MYAVFSYNSQQQDELSFDVSDRLTILRKGDDSEREWWWAKVQPGKEGYVPRNLLGVSIILFARFNMNKFNCIFICFLLVVPSCAVTATVRLAVSQIVDSNK